MDTKNDESQTKKAVGKEEKQKRILEKLGFMQLVFDFYKAPVA